MIKNLNGIKETVDFEEFPGVLLYDNTEYEAYPKHWHSPIEIIMPIQGGYNADIGNDMHYDLKDGDILLINPGTVHSLSPASKEGERIIFQLDFSVLRQIKELESTLAILSPACLISEEKFPAMHNMAVAIMYDILNEYKYGGPLSEASIYAKMIELFVFIGREYTQNKDLFVVSEDKQKEYTEKFMYICDYVNLHCTENISLEMAADLAGFSKFHFTRLFKQFTGVSYYKYLNQRRIAMAENYLIDPSISITEAAIRSGFSSLSAFIRMFRIIKDCTPSEFRKMHDNV